MEDINDESFEEVSKIYERELSRKNSLESKASYIFGVISLIITLFVELLFNRHDLFKNNLIIVLITLFFIISISSLFLCLLIMKVKYIPYPIKITDNINDMRRNLIDINKEEIKSNIYYNYLGSISILNIYNNKDSEKLDIIYYLVIGMILIILLILGGICVR